MRRAASAAGSLRCLVRVRLQPCDQFAEAVRRHVLSGNDHLRIAGDLRNRLEILHQVIRQSKHRAVQDLRGPVADADRVAIAGGTGDAPDADCRRRPGDVLDDDRLTERLAHPLGHDARDRIGRPTGTVRHDHHDRPRRIGVRPAVARTEQERHRTRGEKELTASEIHGEALAGGAKVSFVGPNSESVPRSRATLLRFYIRPMSRVSKVLGKSALIYWFMPLS
jgi:hypothetical protein